MKKLAWVLALLWLIYIQLPTDEFVLPEKRELPVVTSENIDQEIYSFPVIEQPPVTEQPYLGSVTDPYDLRNPYDSYVLTQGEHGNEYNHRAIDLAGGKGSNLYSPINGFVSANYTDEFDNPTIIIENDIYIVTLLHGDYVMPVGSLVSTVDVIGYESNKGYTFNYLGAYCGRTSDCGYHTHITIYNKLIGANIDPLILTK